MKFDEKQVKVQKLIDLCDFFPERKIAQRILQNEQLENDKYYIIKEKEENEENDVSRLWME